MSDPGQSSSANLLSVPDGRMSPVSSRSMKDYATQISELKKENFSLKLRIFYMEERMQEQFTGDHEHVFKSNIELKVECDSLRKELQDKHDLLVKASNAVACMEGGPEEIRKAQEVAQKELQQVKDAMHQRVQEADKELRAVRAEADSLAENVQRLQDYAHKLETDNEKLKKDLETAKVEIETIKDSLPNEEDHKKEAASPEEVGLLKEDNQKKEKLIEQLRESLEVKQTMVEALTDEKKLEEETLEKGKEALADLEEKNKELENELTKRKLQEERLRSEYMTYLELQHEYQQHISEQQQRLDEFEIAARQMSEELEKREEEVRDLSDALKDAEETGKELADNYERLKGEKDEKKTKELLMRDKAISGLTEVIRKKDEEISRLKNDASQRESRLEELTDTIDEINKQEDVLDDRRKRLKELERQLEKLKDAKADLETKNKNLSSELENSEELVRTLDENVKEKDQNLQELLTKYKELLKKQQEDELAKVKACKEQEDMARQFEQEKEEFAEIMSKMKRQFEEATKDTQEKDKLKEIARLEEKLQTVENHLRSKHLQLEAYSKLSSQSSPNSEATNLFKKAESDRKAALEELEAAMKRREEEQRREMDSRNRMNAAKTAEIERLREEIRVKDDRIQNLEDDLLQLDRTAHEARDKAMLSAREASRWKEDSLRKDSVIEELTQNLEALGNSTSNSDQHQIIKLTRENVELKQLLKAREAELSFLQNEQASDDPYIESLKREITRKDKIIADERQLQDSLHNAFVTWSKISEDTSSMNVALDALRLELENHKRELNNAKNMISSLTTELESAHQQILALHKACDAKDRVIEDLKSAQRFPTIESEEGSSTATENMEKSSPRRHKNRQQRFTKKKARKREDDLSQHSSSTSAALKFRSDDEDTFSLLSSERGGFDHKHHGPRIKEELKNDIQELHREIEALKGIRREEMSSQDLLQKLELQKERLRRLADILTEEQKLYRRQINVPRGTSHSESDEVSDITKSKRRLDRKLKQVEDVRTKLRSLLLEVTHVEDASIQVDDELRQSVGSTVFPLNQTSYMDMPVHSLTEEHEGAAAELRKELDRTRVELGNAVRELADLQAASSESNRAKDQLEAKCKEITKLRQQLNDIITEREMKDTEMSKLRIEVDRLRALQLKVGKDSDTDQQPSICSGDESDGMGALSRKELREFIANLRKKLKNAEKLNELLGNQIDSATKQQQMQESAPVDPNLTQYLSSEVERLKDQLRNAQQQLQNAQDEGKRATEPQLRHSDPNASRASLSRSKLPVPVEKTSHRVRESASKDRQDYAQLKTQCAQLQSKLASTEETVRQQTEKLKRCKSVMASAGITDVPMSPVKAARSHPNLLFADDFATARGSARSDSPRRALFARDNSSDTAEARTQTSADDTGYMSISPKSEQKYNSLIQAQAKELSTLRQQLKKARETCKDLRTEYDIILRYVTTLLNTSAGEDTMLATSVTNELDRCKQLTRRLKEQLSEWTSDGSISSDSDESTSSRRVSLAQRQASQLLQKSQEIDEKNQRIRELEKRVSDFLNSKHDGQPPFQKVKGQKFLPENLGCLTPTSSHHSIYTNTEEEFTAFRPTVSQNTEYAPLPDRRSPRPKAGDEPMKFSQKSNKSLPMYQRTIAVTEYLPTSDADGVEGRVESVPGRRRLPTSSDAENCTASYGGSWSASPRKQRESRLSFRPETIVHSSPARKDELREVTNLRRKLDDSNRLNKSLRDELDLTTEALQEVKGLLNHGQASRNPADILDEHLSEIRTLRQHLENSIETNDRLREQLERKLKQAGQESVPDHVSANIYLPAETRCDEKYEKEIECLREDIARANDEVAKLQNQLEAEICLKNNFAAASRELEQLRMRLVESSTQTEILGGYIDDLNKTVAEKDAENEALRDELEQREGEMKILSDENEVAKIEMQTLRQNTEAAAESVNRMREELNRLNEELDESHHLVRSLKSELALYEKLHKNKNLSDPGTPTRARDAQGWNFDVSEFLSEIKSLRAQLERSIEANAALRGQLQEELRRKDSGLSLTPGKTTTINIHHLPPDGASKNEGDDEKLPDSGRSARSRRKLKMVNDEKPSSFLMTPPPSASSCGEDHSPTGFEFAPLPTQGPTLSGAKLPQPNEKRHSWPYYSLHGPYVLGKLTDYNELKHLVTDGRLLVRNMELKSSGKVSQSSLSPSSRSLQKNRAARDADDNLRVLHKMLEDSGRILKLFWPASVPPPPIHLPLTGESEKVCRKCTSRQSDASSDVSKCTRDAGFASDSSINSEADGLRREVSKLHKRLSAQDKLLQSTVDRLQTANRLKEGIEHAILRQLTVTHDVLKKARGNLEAKASETRPKERRVPST